MDGFVIILIVSGLLMLFGVCVFYFVIKEILNR